MQLIGVARERELPSRRVARGGLLDAARFPSGKIAARGSCRGGSARGGWQRREDASQLRKLRLCSRPRKSVGDARCRAGERWRRGDSREVRVHAGPRAGAPPCADTSIGGVSLGGALNGRHVACLSSDATGGLGRRATAIAGVIARVSLQHVSFFPRHSRVFIDHEIARTHQRTHQRDRAARRRS